MDYVNMLNGSSGFFIMFMIISGVLTLVFLISFASLLYHWHYYGITAVRRWLLIGVFGGVSVALLLASYGLLITILP